MDPRHLEKLSQLITAVGRVADALERKCAKCKGHGSVGLTEYNALTGEERSLGTTNCKSCNGKGY